jgi:hypothetical protein
MAKWNVVTGGDSGGGFGEPVHVPHNPPIVYLPTRGLNVVTAQMIFDGKVLPDGDVLNFVDPGRPHPPPDTIEFTLQTQDGMWFKGIEFYDGGGGVTKIEVNHGPGTSVPVRFTRSQLDSCTLVVVKAKALGVHTTLYEIPGRSFGDQVAMLFGKCVQIDWVRD